VGMFVGFGATAMMEGSSTAKVVSLEIDPYLKKWLSDCLEKFPDFRNRHEVMVGSALDSLPKLTGQFDMVFVDANKAEYKRYVEVMLERDLIARGYHHLRQCLVQWLPLSLKSFRFSASSARLWKRHPSVQ